MIVNFRLFIHAPNYGSRGYGFIAYHSVAVVPCSSSSGPKSQQQLGNLEYLPYVAPKLTG